jgi:hypothetical protein
MPQWNLGHRRWNDYGLDRMRPSLTRHDGSITAGTVDRLSLPSLVRIELTGKRLGPLRFNGRFEALIAAPAIAGSELAQ